jgi:hypothetical protein
MEKLSQMKVDAWTVLAGLVVAYLVVTPFRSFVDGLMSGVGGGAQPVQGGSQIDCIYDGAVMTIGPVKKAYAPTTAISGVGHRVFVNGVDRGLKVDGSTLDVTYNDAVEVYYAANNTNAGTNSYQYAVNKQAFSVPCASTISTGDGDITGNEAIKLVAIALPTITAFNDDDGLKNAVSHPENISASDSANIELKIVYGSKGGFAPNGNKMVCLKSNSTLYNTVELSAISGISGSISKKSAPTVVNNEDGLGSESGMEVECFETKGVKSLTTVTEKYNLGLETSTKTPASGNHHKQNSINVSVWDQDWFRNTETGEMELGYETDLNEDVGLASTGNLTVFLG